MSADRHSADRAARWAASGISILNGIFGDHLSYRSNGLAIDMAFMRDNQPLVLEQAALRTAYPDSDGRLCVFLHGLCCNEHSWEFPVEVDGIAPTYGSLLHAELGFTPLFVRYNTGRPIAENGRLLAAMLGELIVVFPVPVRQIILVGHSMGGLVARSACEAAANDAQGAHASWLPLLGKVFYLGTPHEGADLEKFAHAAAAVLDAVPNRVTRLIGDVLNLRSVGIKNLRTGETRPDAADRGFDALEAKVRQYIIAGTLNDDPQHPMSRLFGDGLVRTPAAGDADAQTASSHVIARTFPGVHHMALACDRGVYAQIKAWINEGEVE